MRSIDIVDKAISSAIDRNDPNFQALIGKLSYVSTVPITTSSDFNCGALCNELDFMKATARYYVDSIDPNRAETANLESSIQLFIDLPRRGSEEPDLAYLNRFKTLVNQWSNPRRTTKWAIRDALRYLIPNVDAQVEIYEIFNVQTCYFQLRVLGTGSLDDALFYGNPNGGYWDQVYYAGEGIGAVVSYLGELMDRLKACGVDYDIIFIRRGVTTKSGFAVVGAIQKTKLSDATVLHIVSFDKTADAIIS